MNKEQVDSYRAGYFERRMMTIDRLKEIQNLKSGIIEAINSFVNELEEEQELEVWDGVQEEFSGITREEYQRGLESSLELIKKTYYSENGLIKPRIVKTQAATT